jgi:hypothetical protein
MGLDRARTFVSLAKPFFAASVGMRHGGIAP